jgi:hypothetical protein
VVRSDSAQIAKAIAARLWALPDYVDVGHASVLALRTNTGSR